MVKILKLLFFERKHIFMKIPTVQIFFFIDEENSLKNLSKLLKY